ncbi:plasminogen-like [Branchiostoma floridae]|uniref:Plasminogen-like n=1 Tax=Branchiostoma floridae TaxID=7739 RepID=A0A9J7HUU4_BRAFL|nr:plasminogen-like [Branchiostoma floridae]
MCPADKKLEEKFKKLLASFELCHREAKVMKNGLQQCKAEVSAAKEHAAIRQAITPEPQERKLEHCFVPEMDCYTGYGHYYRGTVNVTERGYPCQLWEAQEPRRHDRTPQNYPHDDLAGHNYCRNPDWGRKPWCYVAQPPPAPRWEHCVVPACPTA